MYVIRAIFIFFGLCWYCQAQEGLEKYLYYDSSEPEVGQGSGQLVNKTKDALLSIDHIEERANYFVFKLKNLTFGEYSDEAMILAPFITGNISFKVNDITLNYDYYLNRSSLNYIYQF